MIFSDEWGAYERLGKMGYSHSRVHHSSRVYVSGNVHTQSIEGFWANTKRGIRGVYHNVSEEYLQDYLDEYVFRYSHRETPGAMFDAFLGRVTRSTD
jgi:hypothetical protein